MDKKRILLVDDDSGLLASLSFVLEQEGYDVLPASDGEVAVEKFRSEEPDIVVLDIKMPRKDGTEVLSEIRTVSQIPVIFLTSKDTEVDELFGLRAGADDYISKPFSTALLVERIRVLLKRGGNGESVGEGGARHHGPLTLDFSRYFCSWKGQEVRLTVTEFLLLAHLVRNSGNVIDRGKLRAAVYDKDSEIDERTIDSHIRRLRIKLRSVDPDFDQIDTLYGLGYRYRKNGMEATS